MSVDRFWELVDAARASAQDPSDADQVGERARQLLDELPLDEVAGLARAEWELRARSYRVDLWGAAYLINGGCSDDGFEYFRGWLIAQGREVFERAVADPDTLAGVPAVRTAQDLESEEMFGVATSVYWERAGEAPPDTVGYPQLGDFWDFDDDDEVRRRFPRLNVILG
ncbi:hypothetical protein FHR83_009264 [Actinoplanes campanulatus]|uniref:DUF4240 domain-containing protein n=1 Tax=Actinoplanes campanulatus TaxID=113559 RepID=A0A7W5ASL9_9ACTN|nr:DUF4240 domain-containing protein [Actinoplanes campanulatus]MBB3101535.1 hypothetical protein [Actinoplanes campanulatus]GGN51884.1 hypothetical protein GCM10010109_92410 [Actinoplanes campanulatus]GID42698.1 hypothetical protein Aca09nite_92040 [Actinoplanes campanulatus]